MDSNRPSIDDTTALPSLDTSQWPSVATTDLLSSNPTIANDYDSFQSSLTEEPSSAPSEVVTSLEPTTITETEVPTTISSTMNDVNGTQSPSPSSIDDDNIKVGDDNPFANDDDEKLLDDDDESWFEKLLPFLPNSSAYLKRNNLFEVGFSSVVLLSLIMI